MVGWLFALLSYHSWVLFSSLTVTYVLYLNIISAEGHNEFFHEKNGGPPAGRRSAGKGLLGEAAAYSAGASVTATMRPSP